jgi:hypothetical protein
MNREVLPVLEKEWKGNEEAETKALDREEVEVVAGIMARVMEPDEEGQEPEGS